MILPDKPMGGSELMDFIVRPHVPKHINLMLNGFEFKDGYNIHWQHQLHDQPSVQLLKNKTVLDNINCIVFVSYYQKQQFEFFLNVPYEKSVVIRNGIYPHGPIKKKNDVIRLVYASTPFRGLDILLLAYDMMMKRSPDLPVHLDVFSDMKLYGDGYSNAGYEHLYDYANNLPNVSYHGVVPNSQLREHFKDMNILAYPNTWEETSCHVAIEAMNAGVIPLVTSIGALPETCSVYGAYYSPMSTDMYRPDNKEKHALQFSYVMENEVRKYLNEVPESRINMMRNHIEHGYSWEKILVEWKELFEVFR